jgi:hypothetical protein
MYAAASFSLYSGTPILKAAGRIGLAVQRRRIEMTAH